MIDLELAYRILFVGVAALLIGIVGIFLIEIAERFLERRAQREREKWQPITDEHAENVGVESYRGRE